MRKPRVPRPHVLPLVMLAAGAVTLGCSAGSTARDVSGPPSTVARPAAPSRAPSARACRQPPAAAVPGADGALSETDTGTFCLGVGRQIDVFLTAPGGRKPGALRWAAVATSDPRKLVPRSSGVLTAPVGVTPGIFRALTAGTVELSSALPDGGRTWHVTIAIG